MLSIEGYKAMFGNVARPTLFLVTLQFPTGTPLNHSFHCKGASIPTKSNGGFAMSFMGRKVQIPGDPDYEDWTVHVYNDIGYTIRRKLEEWGELINNTKQNIGFSLLQEVKRDLLVVQLGSKQEILKSYTIVGAYPQNCGDVINLSWDTTDTPEEYSVTFKYDYWTSDTTK